MKGAAIAVLAAGVAASLFFLAKAGAAKPKFAIGQQVLIGSVVVRVLDVTPAPFFYTIWVNATLTVPGIAESRLRNA